MMVRQLNVRTGQWIEYTVEQWLDKYYDFIEQVLCKHRDQLGGSFQLSGTPEEGRVTVWAPSPPGEDGDIVIDYKWNAVLSAEESLLI